MDYLKYLFVVNTSDLQQQEQQEKKVKVLNTKVKNLEGKLKKNWLERLLSIF